LCIYSKITLKIIFQKAKILTDLRTLLLNKIKPKKIINWNIKSLSLIKIRISTTNNLVNIYIL
jgi:hypothetical protein